MIPLMIERLEVKHYNLYIPQLCEILNIKNVNVDRVKYLIEECLDTEVYIAKTRRRIIGIATIIFIYKLGGPMALIEDVIVHCESEGLGIGSRLVTYLVNYAKSSNCQKIILTCKDKHVKFYEQNGFSKYQNAMCIKFNEEDAGNTCKSEEIS